MRLKPRPLFILFFGCLTAISLVAYAESRPDPALSPRDALLVQTSPFGPGRNPALIFRQRHIQSVQFMNGARFCRYGFSKESDGLIPQSLWVQIGPRNVEEWSAQIVFRDPVSLRGFNALVLWVKLRSSGFGTLRVHMDDRASSDEWTSDPLQTNDGMKKDFVAVLVPLAPRFQDWTIDSLTFQFANGKSGAEADVLGVGLMKMTPSFARSVIRSLLPDQVASPVLQKKPPAKPVPSSPVVSAAEVASVSFATPLPTASIPMAIPLPTVKGVVEEAGVAPGGAAPAPEPLKGITPPTPGPRPPAPLVPSFFSTHRDDILAGLLLTCLLVLWSMFKKGGAATRLPLAAKEYVRPIDLSDAPPPSNVEAAKGYWKRFVTPTTLGVIVSPFQLAAESIEGDAYFGESVLRAHMKAAAAAGVTLVPHLCFIRTLFNYETFFPNAALYLTKPIPSSDMRLSDEELRTRHLGFFPLWVPPFWQKKAKLSQRVLVSYGRLPGAFTMQDSVQFNLRSPQLRDFTIQALSRLAPFTKTIYIEGASALLETNLERHWNGLFGEFSKNLSGDFWTEVLGAVKTRFPKVRFLADAAGPDAQSLLNVGFHFVENDLFSTSLSALLKQERALDLAPYFSRASMDVIKRSVYDVGSLITGASLDPASQRKNWLTAALLGLMPGCVIHEGNVPRELAGFFSYVGRHSLFRDGSVAVLPSSDPGVFAFARWQGRTLLMVIANFSYRTVDVELDIDVLRSGFVAAKLYLFTDILHGSDFGNAFAAAPQTEPAYAVLGRDLIDKGFVLPMPELSLRLYSVSLSRPISHDPITKVRQFHKA